MRRSLLLLLWGCLACWPAHEALAQANVQAAYAGTDPSVAAIDVYFSLGGFPVGKEEDIEGGAATAFLSIPAGITITASIAPSTSTSAAEAFASFSVSFADGTTNTGVVTGVIDPDLFAPNPDGRDIETDLFLFTEARMTGTAADALDLAFFHGATDAPGVEVRIRGGQALAEGVAYGDFATYTGLAPGTYVFDVVETATGAAFASFEAVITPDMTGEAAIAALLGFRDPDANQNGDPLNMTLIFASGASVELPATALPTGLERVPGDVPGAFLLHPNHPNPFSARTTLAFTVSTAAPVQVVVYDMLGREVATLVDRRLAPGRYTVDFDADGLAPGLYVYRLRAGTLQHTRRMVRVR